MSIIINRKEVTSSSSGGFTIIESLIALMILSLALSPMLVVVTMSSRIATSVKNNLVAAMLAQEGIEVVRAVRDANWLNGRSFNVGLNENTIGSTRDGLVQYDTASDLLTYDANTKLNLNTTSGVYSYTDATPTIFSRKISITRVSAVELKIISEVTWNERSRSRIISVEDHLFDWK